MQRGEPRRAGDVVHREQSVQDGDYDQLHEARASQTATVAANKASELAKQGWGFFKAVSGKR